MQVKRWYSLISLLFVILFGSCQKNLSRDDAAANTLSTAALGQNVAGAETPNFNLEVILRNDDDGFGLVKFRQDNDADKIVTLDTWVRNLEPNHSYLLQRAVDTELDGNCTGTTWLTLGQGLQPQAIETDDTGTGRAHLFRDLAAVPSRSTFDIHFQIIDATTLAVVLTSDCYTYTVR